MKQSGVTNLRNQRGFTLTEMVVTVALIGVAATLAVPSFMESLPRIRLKGATRELSADIRLARAEAVSRNKIVYVVFPATGTSYMIREDNEVTGNIIMNVDLAAEYPGVSFGIAAGVNSKPPGVLPIGAPADPLDFTGDNIRLDALGRSMKGNPAAPENGEIYLTNPLGEVYCITVLGTSGRVKVYRWAGATWES